MFHRESPQSNCVPSLYLDYGVDAQDCENGGVEISDRGMRFRSRWHFEVGTQIAVAFVFHHPRLGPQRVTVEGFIVWCASSANKSYESTLLFLELPDELKQSLREFSFQLNAA